MGFLFSFPCSCKSLSEAFVSSCNQLRKHHIKCISTHFGISPFIKVNIKAAFMSFKCCLFANGMPPFIWVQPKILWQDTLNIGEIFACRRKLYFEKSKMFCCMGIKWIAWKAVSLLLEDQVEDTCFAVALCSLSFPSCSQWTWKEINPRGLLKHLWQLQSEVVSYSASHWHS